MGNTVVDEATYLAAISAIKADHEASLSLARLSMRAVAYHTYPPETRSVIDLAERVRAKLQQNPLLTVPS